MALYLDNTLFYHTSTVTSDIDAQKNFGFRLKECFKNRGFSLKYFPDKYNPAWKTKLLKTFTDEDEYNKYVSSFSCQKIRL